MRLGFFFLFFLFLTKQLIANPKFITVQTPQGGKFAIPSTEGFLTSRDLLGKQFFLVFGFTTCPDICPLTLQNMKQVAGSLNKTERESFRFLFVSIDPEVDNLERLKALKSRYGSQYIGATDSEEALKKLTSQFGAFFRIFKTKTGKRVVSHTDSIFHINKEGKWINTLPFGTGVDTLLKELRSVNQRNMFSADEPEQAIRLAENKACDLSKADCKVSFEQGSFIVSLNPKPIRVEKKFEITVKAQSKNWNPTEIDFEGEKINMGYLRPTLKITGTGAYCAKMTLPICELDEMTWVVKLFLRNKEKKLGFLEYRLKTLD